MWMNEYEIRDAAERAKPNTMKGRIAVALLRVLEDVNSRSDGWAHWRAPAKACRQFMTLMFANEADITPKQFDKALAAVRAFYTRQKWGRFEPPEVPAGPSSPT